MKLVLADRRPSMNGARRLVLLFTLLCTVVGISMFPMGVEGALARWTTRDCVGGLKTALVPDYLFFGVIMWTEGNGTAELMYIDANQRVAEAASITEVLTFTLQAMRRPTIFYVNMQDNDLWDMFARNEDVVKYDDVKLRVLGVLNLCPYIFMPHWNPTVDVNGKVGPRVVPIPDFEVFTRDHPAVAPPYTERIGPVVWRGVTTGMWVNGEYTGSDRFRMVNELRTYPGANVRFSGYVQEVGKEVVPWEWMGEPMNHTTMLKKGRIVIDVDGNANAWEGLRWKLIAGATIMKIDSSRRCIQWYYPYLEDGKHLRLVNLDRCDLKKAVAALEKDEELCTTMSKAARDFGLKHLTKEGGANYIFEKLINVHKIQHEIALTDWRVGGDKRVATARSYAVRCTGEMELLPNGRTFKVHMKGDTAHQEEGLLHDGENCTFFVKCPAATTGVAFQWKAISGGVTNTQPGQQDVPHDPEALAESTQLHLAAPEGNVRGHPHTVPLFKSKGSQEVEVEFPVVTELTLMYTSSAMLPRPEFEALFGCLNSEHSRVDLLGGKGAKDAAELLMMGSNGSAFEQARREVALRRPRTTMPPTRNARVSPLEERVTATIQRVYLLLFMVSVGILLFLLWNNTVLRRKILGALRQHHRHHFNPLSKSNTDVQYRP